MTRRPAPELEALIGEEAFVRLADEFGGTRLPIPTKMSSGHRIARAIGIEAARKLVARFAPDVIRIPLAREARAQRYRAIGHSNAQIARRLGITESGVDRLFQRLPDAPPKGLIQIGEADSVRD